MENDNRLPLAALLALVIGAALRLPGLWTDLQLDEVWSIENASAAASWFDILRLKIDNNHHLTSLYMHGLGPNAAAALYRVPAYVFGVATVPLAWLIASRDSRTTAIISATLFATSAALVFYSSEARGYSTVVFLTLAAWYCLQRYAESPKTSYLIGFAVTSVLGMMSHQTFAFFFLGAYIWCDAHMQRTGRLRDATRLTMRMFAREVVSGDPYYDVTRNIYAPLAAACAAAPGTVLANPNDGHYLRYHTQCSVIANNFLVTQFQELKTREENELLSLPAAQLAARAPDVKYVYVRRNSLFVSLPDGQLAVMPRGDPKHPDRPLVDELLKAPADQLPPGFRLLAQEGPDVAPYARAFALGPAAN